MFFAELHSYTVVDISFSIKTGSFKFKCVNFCGSLEFSEQSLNDWSMEQFEQLELSHKFIFL
jgi:hypothetical protein